MHSRHEIPCSPRAVTRPKSQQKEHTLCIRHHSTEHCTPVSEGTQGRPNPGWGAEGEQTGGPTVWKIDLPAHSMQTCMHKRTKTNITPVVGVFDPSVGGWGGEVVVGVVLVVVGLVFVVVGGGSAVPVCGYSQCTREGAPKKTTHADTSDTLLPLSVPARPSSSPANVGVMYITITCSAPANTRALKKTHFHRTDALKIRAMNTHSKQSPGTGAGRPWAPRGGAPRARTEECEHGHTQAALTP